MRSSEEPTDRLLRRLRERQAALVERVSRGNVPGEVGPNGFWAQSGRVCELDDTIALVREILFGERPAEPNPAKPFDPYGVIT